MARFGKPICNLQLWANCNSLHPFERALADQILYEAPQAPRAPNPRISPDLERIILKCIEKDPETRYYSAREVVVDLRRLSQPRTARLKEPVKRPVRSSLLTAAGMLLVAALIAGFWAWQRSEAPRRHRPVATMPPN